MCFGRVFHCIYWPFLPLRGRVRTCFSLPPQYVYVYACVKVRVWENIALAGRQEVSMYAARARVHSQRIICIIIYFYARGCCVCNGRVWPAPLQLTAARGDGGHAPVGWPADQPSLRTMSPGEAYVRRDCRRVLRACSVSRTYIFRDEFFFSPFFVHDTTAVRYYISLGNNYIVVVVVILLLLLTIPRMTKMLYRYLI